MEECPSTKRAIEMPSNWQRCVVHNLPFQKEELYQAMAAISTALHTPVYIDDTARSLKICKTIHLTQQQNNFLLTTLESYLALSEDVKVTWF